MGARKQRRDTAHLPPNRRGSQPPAEGYFPLPPQENMNNQGRAIPGDGFWRNGGRAVSVHLGIPSFASADGWICKSWAYRPAGTRRCGRTGTWHAGPRNTCRRAGVWGCRSDGRRTARRRRRSGSRSPRGSTGPSRHPPPAARGHEKLLDSLPEPLHPRLLAFRVSEGLEQC